MKQFVIPFFIVLGALDFLYGVIFGDKISMLIFRDGIQNEVDVILGQNTNPKFDISKMDKASEDQKTVFMSWMGEEF